MENQLKPLYEYLENDFVNFWELLNVEFGADESIVRASYIEYLKTKNYQEELNEYYIAYKLLRDKYFEKVYWDTKSLRLTYDAGFFLDSLKYDNEYLFSKNDFMPVIPMDKLSFDETKPNIVLITTGGFSPVHEGHLHIMEVAKKNMEDRGYHVAGGYLSPSHDHYVSTKDNGKAHNHALNRIRICNKAVMDSEWLMTSPQESIYTKSSVNYTDVIEAIRQQIEMELSKDFIIGYVFGGDNAPFIRAFQGKDIAICVSRNHERERVVLEDGIEHLNFLYIKENPFNTVSSTKIRRNTGYVGQESNSNIYLIRNDFHYYNQIPEKYSPVEQIKKLYEKTMPEYKFVIIDVENQIKEAKNDLKNKNKKTISMDVYLKGDHNVEISRVFNVADSQIKAKRFVKRPEVKEILCKSISKIKSGEYVLIEDDIASGQTYNFLKSILPQEVELVDKVILSDYSDELSNDYFDVVDLRDFIINSPYSGLVIEHNKNIFRVPYIAPFVDLVSRAKIPAEKVINFSISVLEINKSLYENMNAVGIDVVLNEQTKKLFEHAKLKNYEMMRANDALILYCQKQIDYLRSVAYD